MTVVNQFIRQKVAFKRKILQLEFLKKCRDNNIVPKFLLIKKKENFPSCSLNILRNAELRMLRAYIKNIRKELSITETKLFYQHLSLAQKLTSDELDLTMARIFDYAEKQRINMIKILDRKFGDLMQSQKRVFRHSVNNGPENFINLSKYQPTVEEVGILNKGPKYSHPQELDPNKAICQIEKSIEILPSCLHNSIRGFAAWHVSKYFNLQESGQKQTQQRKFIKAQKNLKSNPNIRILCADKANKFVIVDKEQFEAKSNAVINELQAVEIKNDPTDLIVRKVRNLKKKFPAHRKNFERQPIYATVPPMFFKVKVHKLGAPFRPIVNRRKSPVYYLDKYLSKLLEPLLDHYEPAIKSTPKFLEDLSNLKLSKTARMFTFDVKALYPSIPMEKISKLIVEECKCCDELKDHIPFITQALEIVNLANHFKINYKLYKQKKGAPMGSPLAAKLGEFAMRYIEKKVFANRILKPVFYRRFVDDSFMVWEYTDAELLKFIKEFNSIMPEIQVTLDKEKDGTIPFLDVLIHRCRDTGEIWTEVHHKPSAPLDIVAADTCTYKPYRDNAIIPLIKRAATHSTYEISKRKELNLIKNVMREKGYPKTEFYKLNKKAYGWKSRDNTERKFSGSVQFHPAMFAIRRLYNKLGFNLAFSNKTLKQTICTDRDKPPLIGGIYSIPIMHENTKKCYVGRTRNLLDKRLYQHKYSLRSTYYNTALKQFLLQHDAKPVWNETVLLETPRDDKTLEISEKIQICRAKESCINKNSDRDFSLVWHPLIEREMFTFKEKP